MPWEPVHILFVNRKRPHSNAVGSCWLSPWSPPCSHPQPPPPPPPPQSSVTLSPLPLFFSPAFGRKWSQSSSRITWNNLEWGLLSLYSPAPCSLAQASWSASVLNCVSSGLCAPSKGRGGQPLSPPSQSVCVCACCSRLHSNIFLDHFLF